MVRAILNGQLIAESEQTQSVDGFTYFPPESVRWEHLSASPTQSVCHWKGTAAYFNVTAGDREAPDAAWSYTDPKPAAASIKGHIGFWREVKILRG